VSAWWEELFGSEAWQEVQLGWSSVEDTLDQAHRVIEALDLQPGMRVLDVPCGDGRIALELGAFGCEVVGVDMVPRFVEAGREAAATRGIEHVRLDVGDVREPPGSERGTFDAVICVWGSFGYFDDAGNLAQARAAADALRTGGRYLIDTVSAETLAATYRPRDWFRVADTVVLLEARPLLDEGRIETEWAFLHAGLRPGLHAGGLPVESHTTSVRVYAVHELIEVLREAGFATFEPLDDELAGFEMGAERLWMVATKG
jgi:SAM-dependent methyltransferase